MSISSAPAATASLRRAGSRKATLSLTVKRHPDADDIRSLSVLLPRGVRLVSKKARGKNVKVQAAGANASGVRAAGARKLTIAKLSKGSRRVKVTLRRGSVRVSSKLRRLARKGKRPRVRIKVRSVDTRGKTHSSRVTARARR